jgi:hypothetical protein
MYDVEIVKSAIKELSKIPLKEAMDFLTIVYSEID